jgi:nucleotide-binding universal stress UspA family protein
MELMCRLKVLATIDRSEAAGLVTKFLLALHAQGARLQVVLLNVQTPPQPGGRRFGRELERTELLDLGRRAVMATARHLDAAGMVHEDRVELGDPAETILRYASEQNCGLIVLAEPRSGAVRDWLMRWTGLAIRSTTNSVIHCAGVPVVIAK